MEHTVAATYTESSEFILPGDLNSLGYLFGGKLVSWIDKVGAISAIKHVRGTVVTVSIDNLIFKKRGHKLLAGGPHVIYGALERRKVGCPLGGQVTREI